MFFSSFHYFEVIIKLIFNTRKKMTSQFSTQPNIKQEIADKKEIVNIVNDIKQKYNELQMIKSATEESLKPIVQPITNIESNLKKVLEKKAKKSNFENEASKKKNTEKLMAAYASALPPNTRTDKALLVPIKQQQKQQSHIRKVEEKVQQHNEPIIIDNDNENVSNDNDDDEPVVVVDNDNDDDKETESESESESLPKTLPSLNDPYYGLKYDEKKNQFSIGRQNVAIENDMLFTEDGNTFALTPGLKYLLTCKKVNLKKDKNLFTNADLEQYSQIMVSTQAARKVNNTWNHISVQTEKFQFIKNLIGDKYDPHQSLSNSPVPSSSSAAAAAPANANLFFGTTTPTTQAGSGLKRKKSKSTTTDRTTHRHGINKQARKQNLIKYRNRKKQLHHYMRPDTHRRYQYIYYDNANEIIERLKLLYGEQLAGNNSIQVVNEIEAILEELHELGIY
jgi:hypothetical protein